MNLNNNLDTSEEDLFADSDSHKDPIYIPETSISHYSDSDDSERNKKQRNVQNINKTVLRDEIQNSQELVINLQENLTRKRKCLPHTWKRNKQKHLRLAGKEHFSQAGNIVRAKAVKSVACKCHYNCNVKFNTEDRQEIFQDYLSLTDERAKWTFISSCVAAKFPKRRYAPVNGTSTSKRKYMFAYSLTSKTGIHQVCKTFFLGTLDISGKKVETAMKKMKATTIVEEDRRGRNPAPNKIPEDRKAIVQNHIKSIFVVPSHYCRSSSKRMYLPSGLTENRLYQDYLKYCEEHQATPVTAYYYKHIFTSEFNYSFHRPKKDQCDYCAQFQNKSEDEKLRSQNEYKLHIIRKQEARDHKLNDKEKAKIDIGFRSYTMDMEKILLSPQLEVGQLYYKRKLKTYNFTVYQLADRTAINYMWHETDGNKGASEVATCLWKLLSDLPPEVSEVTFYSDTASGQNRNTIVSAMFIRALSFFDNLKVINQKFMESGHSEMECDSVHSTIENRGRKINIFIPDQWYTVARTAKVSRPAYIVKEMDYTEFKDFKRYSQKLIINKNKNTEGEVMRWLKVKWLQFRKNSPMYIYYKNQLSQSEFKQICIRRSSRKEDVITSDVNQLYQSRLKIEENKLKDLQDLCNKGTIPSAYHEFYKKLTVLQKD